MNHPPVAIVHYHLRRGGVTRVIETASACLTKAGIPHVILCGSPPDKKGKLPIKVVEDLGYDDERSGNTSGIKIVHALRAAVRESFGSGKVIWHLHNHSIGKNRALPDAAGILAESGDAMILQYHDFAEDGRPGAYPKLADSESLYPFAPQIIHTFINSRDRQFLINAGLPASHGFLHPNAITPPAKVKVLPRRPDHPLVLYPVRGIRRKNLGELFLLAALAPKGTRFAVSLKPDNKRWIPVHDEWTAFASDTELPVMLDAVGRVSPAPGAPKTFASWVRHATHFISTAVAEGFGLGFLEPATIGKPLFGRNLPMVTDDFAAEGIHPGRLYDRLLVPESWVGLETLRQSLIRSMRATLESYGHPMSNQHLESSFVAMRHHGYLDFGNLPEDLQRQVIHRLLVGNEDDQILAQSGDSTQCLVEWLAESLAITQPGVRSDQLGPYSTKAYAERLKELYARASGATPETPGHLLKHKVLGEFLKPGSFHFLRT
ncbi:hypothetical protein ACFQY0_05415 [Haloferula chungangensis]|uniref:Glycosyltransferase subfamily 4-like N-terminal domain-containing protein n=1 Tax=Haloferula chungangensis TaxID=1048331 RepID=A0ABW2L537_9BACT